MKNQHFIYILFFIGTKVCRSFFESRERTYWVVRDHLSSDSNYKLATSISIEQCAKQCLEDSECGGANFNAKSKSCAMISKERSSLASLIKQTGSFYIRTITESQSNVSNFSLIKSPIPTRQAAKSCTELFAKSLFSGQGTYPLYWDGKRTARIYCHMADIPRCGRGPWTLAMKIDGSKDTFRYKSSLWTNEEPFNLRGAESAFDSVETKSPVFWNAKVTKICMGMKTNNFVSWLGITHTTTSLLASFKDGFQSTNLSRAAWYSLVPDPSLQIHCNREGFNNGDPSWTAIRLGILGNQEDECFTPDSFIGFGSTFDQQISCGNRAAWYAANGTRNTKSFGYILVQ